MPPAVCTIHQQLDRTYENFQAKTSNLEKFIYLTSLQDRNETLFYRLVLEHIDEMMPIVYTPVVGEACQKYSHIYRRGRGLYIAYEQRHRIEAILRNAGIANPSVIVVTDGERILGLGRPGRGRDGHPDRQALPLHAVRGRLALQHAADHARRGDGQPGAAERPAVPRHAPRARARRGLPGVHRRVRGRRQEGVPARGAAVGGLPQGERAHPARALPRPALHLQRRHPGHGGGRRSPGVYGALRITGQRMRDQRVVFAGAGASAQGISELLVAAFMEDGLSLRGGEPPHLDDRQPRPRHPRRGRTSRSSRPPTRGPSEEVAGYACKDRSRITLVETVENAKPTMLIGVSATPGIFDEPVVRAMARINARPIVFPLSNPTSKTECTPGGRAALVRGPGDRGDRQPVRAGDRGRQAPPHRPVQQRLRLPRRGARA